MGRYGRAPLLGVALLLLSACTGADAPEASPSPESPAVAADGAPSEPLPGPDPTPTPEPSPTSAPPDPTVVPDDLSDIDVEYMQAVIDVFAHNEGEIVREAVEHGEITPRMLDLMDRAYGDDLRDRSVVSWQEEIAADPSLPNFSASPGDPIWTVQALEVGSDLCVGIEILADRSPTAASRQLDEEVIYLVLRQGPEETMPSWRLDRMLAASAETVRGRACE